MKLDVSLGSQLRDCRAHHGDAPFAESGKGVEPLLETTVWIFDPDVENINHRSDVRNVALKLVHFFLACGLLGRIIAFLLTPASVGHGGAV